MAKFQNVSPIGALDIPALSRVIEPGEVFEVPSDLNDYFESQPGNFKKLGNSGRPKKKADEQSSDETDEQSSEEGDELSPAEDDEQDEEESR